MLVINNLILMRVCITLKIYRRYKSGSLRQLFTVSKVTRQRRHDVESIAFESEPVHIFFRPTPSGNVCPCRKY